MKKLRYKYFLLLLAICVQQSLLRAQQPEKPVMMVNLSYYSINNNIQYLGIKTIIKADNKLQPVKDVVFQLYLDSLSAENLIAKVRTDVNGLARSVIPPSLKDKWTASSHHKFISVAEATNKEEETITEIEISRGRLVLDTVNDAGARSVRVLAEMYDNGIWLPEKEVEMKIGVKRLGGQLQVGEEESYTTDSTGTVLAEFKLDSLPSADKNGNIILVAKVEDNDKFGNLSIEKSVPWGNYFKPETNYGQRALWATRSRTPIWLLFMAYSIIAMVWGVIFYLIYLLVKIRKMGKETTGPDKKIIEPVGVALAD